MRWLAALFIFASLLLGCWIRWQYATNDPLWIDELHTSWVVSGDWSELSARAAMGNQSPLYFWCVYPVVRLLGQTPLSLRLISLVAGLALLLLGPWLVWLRTRSMVSAAATAAALAIESQLVFYSSEARPYALLQLGGLLFTWLAFRQAEQREARLGCLTLLLAGLLVYLHPTAVLLTAAVALMYSLVRRYPQRRDGLGILLASLVGIALNPATGNWITRRGLWTGLVDLPLVIGTGVGMLLAGWGAPALVRGWMRRRAGCDPPRAEFFLTAEARCARPLPPEWFWLGCFLVPLLLAVIASQAQLAGLASPRYLAAIWSLPAVGLGLLVAGLAPKRAAAIAALGLFLLAFGGVSWRGDSGWELVRTNPLAVNLVRQRALVGLRNEGWIEIHQQLVSRQAAPTQPIWLYPNLIEDELIGKDPAAVEQLREYLSFPLHGIYRVDSRRVEPRAFRAARLLARQDIEVLSQGEVLVVVRCAAKDLDSLQRDWQREWKNLAAEGTELRVKQLLSAGDVHLLSLEGTSQPRGAEQTK